MARLVTLWRRFTSWWPKIKTPLLVVLLIVAFVGLYLLVEAGYAYPWTGFGAYTPEKPDPGYQRAKTTWDWLQLLIIPIVLAVGGFFLNRTERINAERAAEQRAKAESELAERRAQDAALQAYLDQMTELLLHEKLRTSEPDDEVRSVARARTLTVLRVLDGTRKATVLQFLCEANLIGGIEQDEEDGSIETFDAVVRLGGAYLNEAHLTETNLSGADLTETNLSGANLSGVPLTEANLRGANLSGADLSGADLRWANLRWAQLQGANLREAILRGAILDGADLTPSNITREQLAQAKSYKGATLPLGMAPPVAEVKVAAQEDQATTNHPPEKKPVVKL